MENTPDIGTGLERATDGRGGKDEVSGGQRRAAAGHSTRGRERSSLMKVGRRVDYAVRALAYIAGQSPGRLIGRAEIESHQGVPSHFLAKILRALVNAGLLDSSPGAHGGFRLKLRADDISLLQVYEAVEGELLLIKCARAPGNCCGFAATCTQVAVWRGAQRLLVDYLDGISIAAIADSHGLLRQPSDGEAAGKAAGVPVEAGTGRAA